MKPYNKKMSALLDEATYKSEEGSKMWAIVKTLIERWIFSSEY